jgi:hypothetical protein
MTMVQQIPLDLPGQRGSAVQERRSERTGYYLPASVKARLVAAATKYGVSENEALIACLQWGLEDPLILQLIKRALSSRERISEMEEERRSDHLLPRSVKNRLRSVAADFGAPKRKQKLITITCLQFGLRDATVLRHIQDRAEELRRLERERHARRQEVLTHRAA